MTRFNIRNIKVSHAIFVVPLVPFLVAVVFSAILISHKLNEVRQLGNLSQLTMPISLVSQAVHEQQKERGATAVYLASEGSDFKRELSEQRQLTDLRHADILGFLEENDLSVIDKGFGQKISNFREKFQAVSQIRSDVDSMRIPTKQAIAYYTNLNREMLELVQTVSLLSDDKQVSEATAGFVDFLKGKEKAGIERAVGSSGYAAGMFSVGQVAQLKGLIEAQDVNFANFLFSATPKAKSAFGKMENSASVKEVTELRNLALTKGVDGALGSHTGVDFFDAQTKRINQLKEIENLISGELQVMMSAKKSAAEAGLYFLLAVSAIAGGLALACSVYFARCIRVDFLRLSLQRKSLLMENSTPKSLQSAITSLERFWPHWKSFGIIVLSNVKWRHAKPKNAKSGLNAHGANRNAKLK